MIKKYIEKRKQKQEEYWKTLDYQKQFRIEDIKDQRSHRSLNQDKGCVLQAITIFIIAMIIPTSILIISLGYHFFDYEHYQQIVSIGDKK